MTTTLTAHCRYSWVAIAHSHSESLGRVNCWEPVVTMQLRDTGTDCCTAAYPFTFQCVLLAYSRQVSWRFSSNSRRDSPISGQSGEVCSCRPGKTWTRQNASNVLQPGVCDDQVKFFHLGRLLLCYKVNFNVFSIVCNKKKLTRYYNLEQDPFSEYCSAECGCHFTASAIANSNSRSSISWQIRRKNTSPSYI